MHGDADEVVPVAQAHDLAARMRQLDLPAQLVTVPGLAHDSEHGGESWGDLWPQIADFLAEEPK